MGQGPFLPPPGLGTEQFNEVVFTAWVGEVQFVPLELLHAQVHAKQSGEGASLKGLKEKPTNSQN